MVDMILSRSSFEIQNSKFLNHAEIFLENERKIAGKKLYLYDYMSLHESSSIRKIMKKHKENVNVRIFSDFITRINSKYERKNRICMITRDNLYILYSKNLKSENYKLKYSCRISQISAISIAESNSTLIKLTIQQE